MGLPNINILFKQLAVSAIVRSTRGRVAIIVKDDTNITFSTVTYNLATDVEVAKFTPANVQYIQDCFYGVPLTVTVIRIAKVGGLIADALVLAATLSFDWIGIAETAVGDSDALVTWIKSQELLKKTYKAVVYNATVEPNCKHVVEFTNASVTFTDARGLATGEEYIPSLLGIFAGISLSKSTTYFVCGNLLSVVEVADSNTALNNGELVLINDGSLVRIGSGVNSLTTLDASNTADMQQVVIVESMDLMLNDIRATFKTSYVGDYKNKYDNQVLLISAINSYFKTLADQDILDPAYVNIVSVDIAAQRLLWLGIGKTEASTWTDAQVRNNTFRNSVNLIANVKILGAIQDLNLNISMA